MLAGASGHTLHHVESIADGIRTPPPRRVPRVVIIELVVVALITAAIGVYVLVRVRQHQEGLLIRPTVIPASVSTQTADLMTLSPVPVTSAPGFTLTDQTAHTMSLASLRGKVVVLEFMDPHCTDICPIVSQEFITAYRDLGRLASRVVFIAVNVNQYHLRVADVAAFSREQRLQRPQCWSRPRGCQWARTGRRLRALTAMRPRLAVMAPATTQVMDGTASATPMIIKVSSTTVPTHPAIPARAASR